MRELTRTTSNQPDDYWSGVASTWVCRRPFRLWREFADLQQWSLVASWLDASADADPGSMRPPHSARILKTDLFDEVAGRGITHRLLESGLRVTGIDISPFIVNEAVSRNEGLHAVAADVRCLPFADASFDAVYSGSTLDHFDSEADICAALRELRRILRPGGRLLLTMDNAVNPVIRLRNGPLLGVLRLVRVVPYQVGVTLGPGALEAAIVSSGYRVMKRTAVMHCPRVLAVALSRVVSLLPQVCERAFLQCMAACEGLDRLPTRWYTGYYTAIEAIVP